MMNKTPWGCIPLIVLLVVAACSAEPEETGACKLDCSGAKVGSVNYKIEPLSPEGFTNNYSCVGNAKDVIPFDRPVSVAFRVIQEVVGAESGQQGYSTDLKAAVNPIPGVAFEPYVVGRMDNAHTNEEHLQTIKDKDGNDAKVPSPAAFAGIVTPKAEWCSDTCGVMRLEVWPTCVVPLTSDVAVGVRVGAVKVDTYVSFQVVGTLPEAP